MTTDREQFDSLGDTVHDAYRRLALSESQRRQQREQFDVVARQRGSDRLRSHLIEVAVVAAIALIVVSTFFYWNSLDPGSNDDDPALAGATSTAVKCFSDLPNFSRPSEVQDQLATQWAAEGYVDCTTPPATDATPTPGECVPLPDVLQSGVPAEVTQPISGNTVYCPPDPTPTFTPAPTVLPTVVGASGYGYIGGVCRATPYVDNHPRNPELAGFTDTWFGGELFGLWAGLDRDLEGVWTTSNTVFWAAQEEIYWWEQDALAITIQGRRIDAQAPPMEIARLPVAEPSLDDTAGAAAEPAAAMLIEMRFPEPGCWEIVGLAGEDLGLSFVVEVVPEEQSAPANRARQHQAAVVAEREAAMPYSFPDTCAVDAWSGPENRLLGRYPDVARTTGDWTYSYFLDGDGLSLNARLGLFFQGANDVFLLTSGQPLPGDATIAAEFLDAGGPGEGLMTERIRSTYSVTGGDGERYTVERAELTFPASGCWTLRVEIDGVDFDRTVYVYPPAEDRAEIARDHERLYTVDLDGRLHGIDLETGARFVSLFVGSYADVVLAPDGLTLYVIAERLSAYDAITGEERWSTGLDYRKVNYILGYGPSTIAVSPDGSNLYVYGEDGSLDSLSYAINMHDAATGQLIGSAPIPVSVSETGVVSSFCAALIWPSQMGDRLLAPCNSKASYHLLDLESSELLETASMPASGVTVATAGSARSTRLYVLSNAGQVAIFDREALELVDIVTLRSEGLPTFRAIALSPDGTLLYVPVAVPDDDGHFREIRVFDTSTWEEVERIELGFEGGGQTLNLDSVGNLYGVEMLSATQSLVWKRFAATGETTTLLVTGSEVRQLLWTAGN